MSDRPNLFEGSDQHRHVGDALVRGESVLLLAARSTGLSGYLEQTVSRLREAGAGRPEAVVAVDLRLVEDDEGLARAIAAQTSIRFPAGERGSLTERVVTAAAEKRSGGLVVALDHLGDLDAAFQATLVPVVRHLASRQRVRAGRGRVGFVVGGAFNPPRLRDICQTSPVDNLANRIQLPTLGFEAVERVTSWAWDRQGCRAPLTEELQRRLYDLCGDNLELLNETVRALRDGLDETHHVDDIVAAVRETVLRDTLPGRRLLDALHAVSAEQFRLLARVYFAQGPRSSHASWFFEPNHDVIDLCVNGVLTRTPGPGVLGPRNEYVTAALALDDDLRDRLCASAGVDRQEWQRWAAHHLSFARHALTVAFARCHEVELALRRFVGGLVLQSALQGRFDQILASIPASNDRRGLREVRAFFDGEGREYLQEGVVVERLLARLGARMKERSPNLLDVLRERAAADEPGEEPAVDAAECLGYATLHELATVLEQLGRVLPADEQRAPRQGRPDAQLETLARAAREFAALRNRVAHHRPFGMTDQRRLRDVQDALYASMARVWRALPPVRPD